MTYWAYLGGGCSAPGLQLKLNEDLQHGKWKTRIYLESKEKYTINRVLVSKDKKHFWVKQKHGKDFIMWFFPLDKSCKNSIKNKQILNQVFEINEIEKDVIKSFSHRKIKLLETLEK